MLQTQSKVRSCNTYQCAAILSASKWNHSIRSEFYVLLIPANFLQNTRSPISDAHFSPVRQFNSSRRNFIRCLGPVSGDKIKSRQLLPPRSPKCLLFLGEYRRINCEVIILALKPTGKHSKHSVVSFASRACKYNERRDWYVRDTRLYPKETTYSTLLTYECELNINCIALSQHFLVLFV
jgi:hypothetical protein